MTLESRLWFCLNRQLDECTVRPDDVVFESIAIAHWRACPLGCTIDLAAVPLENPIGAGTDDAIVMTVRRHYVFISVTPHILLGKFLQRRDVLESELQAGEVGRLR